MKRVSVLQKRHKGNLPIRVFSKDTLSHFQELYTGFSDEIKHELSYGGLQPKVYYDCHKTPIVDRACLMPQECPGELGTPNSYLYVKESYCAALWCLCYAVLTIYKENGTHKPNFQPDVDVFNYGLSLYQHWSPWDKHLLANPEEFDEAETQHISAVNGLFLYGIAFVLCHEFTHQQLGHSSEPISTEESIKDEFAADEGALKTMRRATEGRGLDEVNSIKLGTLLGSGSILFPESTWSGGPSHPDTDQRLTRILENLTDGDEESDLWEFGRILLLLWGLIHNKDFNRPKSNEARRGHFYALLDWMKAQQDFM
ncbi:phage exclusion protein Lit family protein [Spirosoma rhododendri]|uniref:Uncharacterized protein n=1 Tax=Spirosoma rhododendri TaxID=2728024 RepID=A0A7L5DSU1_9BACT|nr:phage exclusion protein Lit family protein [Spirosoma rhododendri]QJD81549.1 hypothetical protein HH216_24575 [Spirosoma rhododendri]